MVDSRFIKHYDVNNSDLNLIIEAMRHPNKEDARNFLCMINDLMNYYMSRTDDEVRYPLLYIPVSEPWAQEVCIEFVILKISLLYNELTQIKLYKETCLQNYVHLPENCSKKKHLYLDSLLKYKKKIYRTISERHLVEPGINKNLIVCDSSDISSNCNPFLSEFCGEERTINSTSFAISRADPEVKKLDRHIKKDRGKTFNIENLFVFLSRNVNGRFSDAYSFQRPSIERLNKLGAGIKNVFYFYFSTKPYKLQRQLTWKLKNASDILHEDIREMRDFISITADESDYIFGRGSKQFNFIIKHEGVDEFKTLADDALDACEYNVQARNNLAVCFDELSQTIFKEEYGGVIDDIDAQYFDIFLKNIQDIWENKIFPEIAKFLNGETEVCLILDFYMPDEYKHNIASRFEAYGIKVNIDSFKSLSCRYSDGRYSPINVSKKIIVLSYQGHYASRPYAHYPNSFDPICLSEGQELLNIINPFVFDPYFAVQNYEYFKTLRSVLFSDYRNNYLKCPIALPDRPKRKIEEGKDRSVTHSGSVRRPNQNYKRYNASTKGGKSIKLTETDSVICKSITLYSEEQIITVSDLNILMQQTDQTFFICPLSKIQRILESIIEEKEDEIKKDELYIRKDERYGLTDDEVMSESELWEILLRRKVDKKGADSVYAELMEKIPYSEQIKRVSFDRWYTPNNNMILPRSRRMQDALFQYLAIATPYDKIIRRKKAQKGTKTEQKNTMLRSFLCNNLFTSDFQRSFERLSDGIKDILGLDRPEDLEALIDMLNKEIEYIEINKISTYDKN